MRGKGKQSFLLGLTLGLALFAAVGAAVVRNEGLANFETLKSLHGDWVKVGPDGLPSAQVNNAFQVTAAGTVLMETVFPGTDHEMVTLYYLKDGEVALTHYCVEGNQPRMRLVKAAHGELEFECSGEGLKSENERHMHRAKFTFVGPNRIRTEWFLHENGKNVYTAESDLVRRES